MKAIAPASLALLVLLLPLSSIAEPAKSVTVQVRTEGGTAERVRVLPLVPDRATQDERLTPVNPIVEIAPSVPTLVCAGARGMAVACEYLQTDQPLERTFTLTPGREVRLRCVLDRKPAGGAIVRLQRDDIPARTPYALPLSYSGGAFTDKVLANSEGEVSIRHLAPGTYRLEVSVEGYPPHDAGEIHVPPQRARPDGSPEDRTLTLSDVIIPSGTSVDVDVLDASAQPVENAQASIRQPRDSRTAPFTIVDGSADEKGRVTLFGLDPLRPTIITCLAPGYARNVLRLDTLPSVVQCTLQKFAVATGVVLNDQSEPIVGARIQAGERETVTDDAGEFKLLHLPPGETEFAVHAAGHTHSRRRVQLPSGETTNLGEVVLSAGWLVTGRVADAVTKKPIVGAVVRNVHSGTTATTNEEGTYTGDGELGAVLEASAPGYAGSDRVVLQKDANDFLLEQPGVLIVTVWDDVADRPCVHCTIFAAMGRLVRSAITDETAQARLSGLSPGEYDIGRERVHASSSFVTVTGGEGETALVQANQTTHVTLGQTDFVDVVFLPATAERRLSVSASDGFEVLDALPSGAYRTKRRRERASLALLTPNTGVLVGAIPERFSGTRWEIRLHPTKATVRCITAGQPVSGAMVELRNAHGRIAWGTTNAQGEVQLTHVPPGHYDVHVTGRPVVQAVIGTASEVIVVMRRE